MKNLMSVCTITTFFLVMMVISMVSGLSLHRYNHNYNNNGLTAKKHGKRHTTHHSHHHKTSSLNPTKTMSSTTSSIIASPTSSPTVSNTSPSSGTYTGDGTWFNTGLGSCGWTNVDTDLIAAMDAPLMNNPANPNLNPLCGKMIKITNLANNKSVTVKIVDTCPPCLSGSVDMSPAAFSQIADLATGRIKISWNYV